MFSHKYASILSAKYDIQYYNTNSRWDIFNFWWNTSLQNLVLNKSLVARKSLHNKSVTQHSLNHSYMLYHKYTWLGRKLFANKCFLFPLFITMLVSSLLRSSEGCIAGSVCKHNMWRDMETKHWLMLSTLCHKVTFLPEDEQLRHWGCVNIKVSFEVVKPFFLYNVNSYTDDAKSLYQNSPLPDVAYMRQWIGLALVQIVACRLFGVKPLSKPIPGYCQLDDLRERTSVEIYKNTKFSFHVNAYQNIVHEMVTIFPWGRLV